MTAPTRSTVTILAATLVTAGGTKAAPAHVGGWVDVRTLNGGDIGWSVKNGGSAPGVQGQFTLQVADTFDGTTATNITDLWSGGGNTAANGEETGLIDLPNTASYVREICYGHTTNQVMFKAVLFAKA